MHVTYPYLLIFNNKSIKTIFRILNFRNHLRWQWSSYILFLALLIPSILALNGHTYAGKSNKIEQYGITFTFQSHHQYGQFANGDYWVVGPVTITAIDPPMYVHNKGKKDETWRNGWEVNPKSRSVTGLSDRCSKYNKRIDLSLVPDLPYRATPGESIVKAVSRSKLYNADKDEITDRQCVNKAAVLTVVGEVPPNSGADVFRPPYVGTQKPFFRVGQIRKDLLPSLKPNSAISKSAPSFKSISSRFKKVQLDHTKDGALRRALYPTEHMPSYDPQRGKYALNGILRLFLDDPYEEKKAALIQMLQYGIDQYYIVLNGQSFERGGGHTMGRLLPMAFFSVLLGDQKARDNIASWKSRLDEHRRVQPSRFDKKMGLYGSIDQGPGQTIERYWKYLSENPQSNYTRYDPYGYIDGNMNKKHVDDYLPIIFPVMKGEVLAAHLMPELIAVFNSPPLFNFVERFAYSGLSARPDPCAPAESNWANYKITFGPDPNNKKMCILDPDLKYYASPTDFECKANAECGRLPSRHGNKKNAMNKSYVTNFQEAMWKAFYSSKRPQASKITDNAYSVPSTPKKKSKTVPSPPTDLQLRN